MTDVPLKLASMIKEAPFKSQAQRRKFYAMAASGEISKKTLKEWVKATPKGKKLPERVKKAEAGMLFALGFVKASADREITVSPIKARSEGGSGVLPWLVAGSGFGAGLAGAGYVAGKKLVSKGSEAVKDIMAKGHAYADDLMGKGKTIADDLVSKGRIHADELVTRGKAEFDKGLDTVESKGVKFRSDFMDDIEARFTKHRELTGAGTKVMASEIMADAMNQVARLRDETVRPIKNIVNAPLGAKLRLLFLGKKG